MPEFDPVRLLDPHYWLEPQPGAPGLVGQLVDILLLLAMFGGLLLVNYANRRLETHPFKYGLLQRVGRIIVFYSAVVVLIFTVRYLGIPYLGSRLMLLVAGVVGLGLALYGLFYYVRLYPKRLAEAERQLEIERYKPAPKSERKRRKKKKRRR